MPRRIVRRNCFIVDTFVVVKTIIPNRILEGGMLWVNAAIKVTNQNTLTTTGRILNGISRSWKIPSINIFTHLHNNLWQWIYHPQKGGE